jgi:hypothetical protein
MVLKAAGVLELKSYWSKGFSRPVVLSLKRLKKLLVSHSLLKAARNRVKVVRSLDPWIRNMNIEAFYPSKQVKCSSQPLFLYIL